MSLENRYGLLIRAYPKGRRRTEILGTLIEAAPPGRGAPSVRETVNLIRHGLRARLGRPGSRGVVVIAALIALVAGFAGAAAVTRVAWELAPAYPSGAALHELDETLFPGLGSFARPAGDGLFTDPTEPSYLDVLARGHNEDFEFATLWLGPDGRYPGDFRPYLDGVQARLAAAGWQIGDTTVNDGSTGEPAGTPETSRAFTATRDGLFLRVSADTDSVRGNRYALSAALDRLTPWWITVLTFVGLLLGGLAGWLATGWASRRTEHSGRLVRSLTREPVIVALLLLLPQPYFGWLNLKDQLADPAVPPGFPFWTLSVTYFYGLVQLGVVLLVFSLLVALIGGSRRTAAVARPPEPA